MSRARILPTGAEVAHQAILTIGVTVLVLVILSQAPGLSAWLKRQRDGLPL